MTRIAFQTRMRAACVELLNAYKTASGIRLAVYPGRPSVLSPPHAFIDRIDETINYTAALRQRHPVAQIVVVWGLFDSQSAANQRDALVDTFLDVATDLPEQANANTQLEVNNVTDIPVYNPDWGPEAQQQTSYYATRFFVEGLALEGD
jgi:hypothetical protein